MPRHCIFHHRFNLHSPKGVGVGIGRFKQQLYQLENAPFMIFSDYYTPDVAAWLGMHIA